MELIDTGVNLTHDSFDADRAAVIDAAREAGVRCMVVTGTTVDSSRDAAQLASGYAPEMYSTAGIHPHHATDCDAEAIDALQALAQNETVVAIGECGLDYFRDFSPRHTQREAFEQQLQLACESGLPAFLHQRDAHDDFLAILRNFRSELVDAVAHCFTGSRAQLDDYLSLDLHIGITGWVCDERRSHELQSAVPGIPLDRLLIETDAPYLLPRNIEPKPKTRRNEPALLPYVVVRIAELMRVERDLIAAASTDNARRFFRLD
jgi:TatD DNase family protein